MRVCRATTGEEAEVILSPGSEWCNIIRNKEEAVQGPHYPQGHYILLTKALSIGSQTIIMAKGCVVAGALPMRCFLLLLHIYIHCMPLECIVMHIDKKSISTGTLPTPNPGPQ